MGLIRDVMQTAKEDVKLYFKPLKDHPILLLGSSIVLGGALAAYEFGTSTQEFRPDKNSENGDKQIQGEAILYPNLDTLSE